MTEHQQRVFPWFFVAMALLVSPSTAAELTEKTVIRKVEDSSSKGFRLFEITHKFDAKAWSHKEFEQKGSYPVDVFVCLDPVICRKGTAVFVDYLILSFLKPYSKETIPKLSLSPTSINKDFVNLAFGKAQHLNLNITSIDAMEHITIAETPYIKTSVTTLEKRKRKVGGIMRFKSWPVSQFTTVDNGMAILTTVVYGARNPTKSSSENNITPAIVELIKNRSIRLKNP